MPYPVKVSKTQVEKICKKLGEDLVKFSFLASGKHNANYSIETKGKKYVLRIENNPQFKNLKREYALLRTLKPGLGPKAYFLNTSRKIMPFDYFVEEFIEGKPPKVLRDKFIIHMARWLKKLHSGTKPSKKHSLLRTIKPYFRNVRNHMDVLSNDIVDELVPLMKRVSSYCRKNDDIFGRRSKISLLHRDLSRENIIYDGKNITLLDWEFSRYDFPEWDLVYIIKSLKFNDRQENLFLRTYGYPTAKRGELLIISLLNTCGDAGYSVWRLGLVKQGKLSKKLKAHILRRLNRDIALLRDIIGNLES